MYENVFLQWVSKDIPMGSLREEHGFAGEKVLLIAFFKAFWGLLVTFS